jgi:hypothetical protein
MKKVLYFDDQGEICAIASIEDGLSAAHNARDPRWSKIEIAHEDERVIATGGGHARHFVAPIGEAITTAQPAFVGTTPDGTLSFGVYKKSVVMLEVSGQEDNQQCPCDAVAHAIVADPENEVAGTTLTLQWNCPEPIKLWVGTEPVAGPLGGMCHETVRFTPPFSGRIKITGRHPRFYIESITVHSIEQVNPDVQ